jgi:hypothetical protein
MTRRAQLSRNTILKYSASRPVEPEFNVPDRPSKIAHYATKLSGWLKKVTGKSRKQWRTSIYLHDNLVKLGYIATVGRVGAFAR